MTGNSFITSLAQPEASKAVCVLGMHRSGTSALTGLLHLLGVDLGRSLLPPNKDNPRGYWENSDIVSWHMGLLHATGSWPDDFFPLPDGWERDPRMDAYIQYMQQFLRAEFGGKGLWGFKDPRACRLVPIWRRLLDSMGVQGRYVLMVRNPDEVARSLSSRSTNPYNQSLMSALVHMLEAERHTRGQCRVVVSYDQIMSDWAGESRRIGAALGIEWPRSPELVAGPVGHFLDLRLRHHTAAPQSTAYYAIRARGADPHIAQCTYGVYHALAAAAGGAVLDTAALDEIAEEYCRSVSALRAWRPGPPDHNFVSVNV